MGVPPPSPPPPGSGQLLKLLINIVSCIATLEPLPDGTAVVSSPGTAVLSSVGKRNKHKNNLYFKKQTICFEVILCFYVRLECIVKELVRANDLS